MAMRPEGSKILVGRLCDQSATSLLGFRVLLVDLYYYYEDPISNELDSFDPCLRQEQPVLEEMEQLAGLEFGEAPAQQQPAKMTNQPNLPAAPVAPAKINRQRKPTMLAFDWM